MLEGFVEGSFCVGQAFGAWGAKSCPMDVDGILPDVFAEACERLKPKGLYINPTLQTAYCMHSF